MEGKKPLVSRMGELVNAMNQEPHLGDGIGLCHFAGPPGNADAAGAKGIFLNDFFLQRLFKNHIENIPRFDFRLFGTIHPIKHLLYMEQCY